MGVLPSGMASMRFVERSSSTSDSRFAISDGSTSRRLSARLPPCNSDERSMDGDFIQVFGDTIF
jgi:hypothetical protein